MHLDNRTGWPFVPLAGRLDWPKHSLTAVLKGTFRLVPGGTAEPADDPLPPEADVWADGDDPAVDAPRYASDLDEFKPRADLLLVGRAWAPGGRRARQFHAAFQVGTTRKELRVSGDRRWDPGLLKSGVTEPAPVRSVELSWRHAFGGPGCAANPVGTGAADDAAELPNLEDPADPVVSRQTAPTPAGFGPRARTWTPRAGAVGTFDAEWYRTRCPWYPADRDWSCANAAPADLQVEGWLRGDETAILENLHREHARIECRLPGVAPRCFAQRADGRFDEAPLRLDTLWIDAETLTLVLVWRGVLEIGTDDFSDLGRLFVVPDVCGRAARDAASWRAELLPAAATSVAAAAPADAAAAPEETEDPSAAAPAGPAANTGADADDGAADPDDGVPDGLPDPELPDDAALRDAALTLKSAGVADLDPADLLDSSPAEDDAPEADAAGEESAAGAGARVPSPWTAEAVAAAAADGTSLAGENLAGLDLRGAALDEADLEGADLTGARLDGASLRRAILAGATLDGATATEACFDGAWLCGADLTGAGLERASLAGTDLSGACLERARLDAAQLAGARLDGARAAKASFVRACLRGAQLADIEAPGADFGRADLSDAALDGARCGEATFDRATLPRSSWAGADARGARFVYAEASEADFTGARLDGVDLARGNFRHACFRKARLNGAHVREANLFGALLVYAELDGADARKANLYGAELADASRRDLRIEGANIKRTKLDPGPRFP